MRDIASGLSTMSPTRQAALRARVIAGDQRAKITIRFLLANPLQEGLKLGSLTQQIDAIIRAGEVGIGIGRVKLLVAGFAEWRAMLGFAALLSWSQVMQRNEAARDLAVTQRTGDKFRLWIMHEISIR